MSEGETEADLLAQKQRSMLKLLSAEDWLGEYSVRGREGMSREQYDRCVAAVLRRFLDAAAEYAEIKRRLGGMSTARVERAMARRRAELDEIEARLEAPSTPR